LYNAKRKEIITQYPRFQEYFEYLEKLVQADPLASGEETILYEGKPVHVRKRYLKTTFFSGLLPDTYMYLTVTYGITAENKAVFLLANLHDFIC
jgi:hypothetical protein